MPLAAPARAPDDQPGAGGLAPGAVVADLPALGPRVGAELRVGVDRARVPDQAQHRQVVDRVRVRRAGGQVEPLARREGLDRLRLGRTVQQVADEPAGVDRRPRCSATVPIAPVSPRRRAMIRAISMGAAVTSQTRWPWSRWSWARARVPGQMRWAMRLVEDLLTELLELRDGVAGDEATGRRRASRRCGRGPRPRPPGSRPASTPRPAMSRVVKNLRRWQARGRGGRCSRPASPCCRRRRTPRTVGSGGRLSRAVSTSAAAAAASPARVERCRRSSRGRRSRGRGHVAQRRPSRRSAAAPRRRSRWAAGDHAPPDRRRCVGSGACPSIPACATSPRWSRRRRHRSSPEKLALVEAGGRSLTWAELERRGRPAGDRARRRRHRGGPPGADRGSATGWSS